MILFPIVYGYLVLYEVLVLNPYLGSSTEQSCAGQLALVVGVGRQGLVAGWPGPKLAGRGGGTLGIKA